MSKHPFSKAESASPGLCMKRVYLILIDFVLPLPMTALTYWLWYRRTGSWMFSAYPLALGVLFGYIFPGIGTNVFHLWKFNGPFKMGNYFIHHGFMYAPYLALVFYVAFPAGAPLTVGNIVRILMSAGFIQCVLSCHHDTWGVATGMIEIATPPGNRESHSRGDGDALRARRLLASRRSLFCKLPYCLSCDCRQHTVKRKVIRCSAPDRACTDEHCSAPICFRPTRSSSWPCPKG